MFWRRKRAQRVVWVLATFEWLLRSDLGYVEWVRHADLVLPNDESFPVKKGTDSTAAELFDLVREYAGLTDWPCRLVPIEQPASAVELLAGAPAQEEQVPGVAGTFGVHEEDSEQIVEITYADKLADDADAFVATMAHELAHYLMHTFDQLPPGYPEAEEPATDICSVHLCFGVFACNTAFRFNQFTDGAMHGWQVSRQRYLEPNVLAFALAVYLEITGNDVAEVKSTEDGTVVTVEMMAHC